MARREKSSKVLKTTKLKSLKKTPRHCLYFNQWLKSKQKQWFTLGDLKKLKKGQTLELLSANRNVADALDDAIDHKRIKKGIPYVPIQLFRKIGSIVKYTHDHGASGKILHGYSGSKLTDFTFEPLIKDHKGVNTWQVKSNSEVSKLPDDTPVGWRGGVIALQKAGKTKVIVADDPNDEFTFL